jgi:NADPH:quinone reductase-like Zn-dependent oxidoreductase
MGPTARSPPCLTCRLTSVKSRPTGHSRTRVERPTPEACYSKSLMRALAIDGYGLDHVGIMELPDPHPGDGEVMVRVRAAALNRLDLWTLSGTLNVEHHFPHVLGADGSGHIEDIGSGAGGLVAGTTVLVNPGLFCGKCEFCRAGEQSLCTGFRLLGEHVHGTFAEFVVLPASNVHAIPEKLSMKEAAVLGVTFTTGYRMLFTRGRLQPGESVLITGIGGGLALSMLQLARPVAGTVLVTSSSDESIRRAIKLGADAGVNYLEEDVGVAIRRLTGKRGVDLAVDSAGAPALDPALRSLRKGGRLMVAGATAGAVAEIDVRRLFWNQIEVIGSTMGSNEDFSNMLRFVSGRDIRPAIDREFALEDGRAALQYLQDHRQFGKVILNIDG